MKRQVRTRVCLLHAESVLLVLFVQSLFRIRYCTAPRRGGDIPPRAQMRVAVVFSQHVFTGLCDSDLSPEIGAACRAVIPED